MEYAAVLSSCHTSVLPLTPHPVTYPSTRALLCCAAALFGLGAALALFYQRHRPQLGRASEAMLQSLGVTLAINMVYSLLNKRIDNWWVGVGGSVCGWVLVGSGGGGCMELGGEAGGGQQPRVVVVQCGQRDAQPLWWYNICQITGIGFAPGACMPVTVSTAVPCHHCTHALHHSVCGFQLLCLIIPAPPLTQGTHACSIAVHIQGSYRRHGGRCCCGVGSGPAAGSKRSRAAGGCASCALAGLQRPPLLARRSAQRWWQQQQQQQ